MPFPAEQVPDGNVWLAHHFIYGAWATLFVCWLAAEEDRKPWAAVSGILVALFSWYHLWPMGYPITGATGVLVGLAIASLAVAWRQPWRVTYPANARAACLLCLLIAWDDALEHAFGVWVPLNWVWEAYLLGNVP